VSLKNKENISTTQIKTFHIYADIVMLYHRGLESSVYEVSEEFDHPGSADSDRNDGG